MYPDLQDVLNLLEEFAPARLAEPWDNPGLQVGALSYKIQKIYLSLDPTLKALRTALLNKAQLLLTHHPLIFSPLSRLDMDSFPGDVIREAVLAEIGVVAAHTNLDVAPGGINDILAELLGLEHVKVLQPIEGTDGAGMGRIGELPFPRRLSVLTEEVKKALGTTEIRVVCRTDKEIRRLAVVGGSGGSLISLAFQKKADALLTGDLSYHQALEAETLGLALMDGGHFGTEKTAFTVFGKQLKAMITNIGWDTIVQGDKEETDPIRFS
jgi:dinuclear metal center YbgI/SA1388 family protein